MLGGYTWDIVAAGEAFARSVGGEDKQVRRRSDLDLRTLDRDLVARWLEVPSDERERYELWPVVGAYPVDQYAAIAEAEAVMNTMPHDDLDVEDAVMNADWVAQRDAAVRSIAGGAMDVVRSRARHGTARGLHPGLLL